MKEVLASVALMIAVAFASNRSSYLAAARRTMNWQPMDLQLVLASRLRPSGAPPFQPKGNTLMDRLSELANLIARLGGLRRELQATDSIDLEKINNLQEKIGVLQNLKDKLLGITE